MSQAVLHYEAAEPSAPTTSIADLPGVSILQLPDPGPGGGDQPVSTPAAQLAALLPLAERGLTESAAATLILVGSGASSPQLALVLAASKLGMTIAMVVGDGEPALGALIADLIVGPGAVRGAYESMGLGERLTGGDTEPAAAVATWLEAGAPRGARTPAGDTDGGPS